MDITKNEIRRFIDKHLHLLHNIKVILIANVINQTKHKEEKSNNDCINKYFISNNILTETKDIFPKIVEFITIQHAKNIFPTDEIIADYITTQCENKFNSYQFIELKKKIENLYTEIIKPSQINGIKEFIINASANNKLCITSDTFFIRGKIIKEILSYDGILEYFDAFFFSDEIGFNKTNHKNINTLIDKYNFSNEEVVHIGDSIESDGTFARNSNIHFIHFLQDKASVSSQKYFFHAYSELSSLLNKLMHDSNN